MPADQKSTDCRIVVDYFPRKEDPYQTRLTVGRNSINHPGDVGTSTADMLTSKLLFNSVLSTPYAKFMVIDIENFYLNTSMNQY